MMDDVKKKFINHKMQKFVIISIFIAYFIVGIFLIRDYGISTDEPQERNSMYVNINYIFTQLGKEPMEVEALDTWKDKYYGMVLQFPMFIFEKLADEMDEIYLYRHLYTFCLCFIGYIFFFLLCKKLLKSNLISIIGTLMLMLYPRFFAEQFYNIKDMVFVAVFIVSMWATVQLIENNFSKLWIILFSLIVALTTNVRIVGVIFILVILAYLWCERIIYLFTGKQVHQNLTNIKALGITISILLLFFTAFAISIPATWKNPVEGVINAFTTFSHFDWNGSIVFMGKIIEDLQIPWYYIPVWIVVSVPIWYIVLTIISIVLFARKVIKEGKKDKLLDTLIEYKYMLWALVLFGGPWMGMTILGSTLYNGWRHCYFMLPPMILLAMYGLVFMLKKKKEIVLFGTLTIILLSSQAGWIIKNHPYEMVYFNSIGRKYASEFDRDYWHMAEYQAWKYIAEHDGSEKISVNSLGTKHFRLLLTEEELDRVEFSEDPVYYIDTYRGRVGNDYRKEGYEELYSFVVDDFKIATIFKKIE